jgi:thiol-disulfide isomerase/thioredoxin
MSGFVLLLYSLFLCQGSGLEALKEHRDQFQQQGQPLAIQETVTVVVEEGDVSVSSSPISLHIERDPRGQVRIDIRDFIAYVDARDVTVIDSGNDEAFLRIEHDGQPWALLQELFADIPSLWLQLAIETPGDIALLESLHPALANLSYLDADSIQSPTELSFESPDARVSISGLLPGRMDVEINSGDWVEPGARIRWEVVSRPAPLRGTAFDPEDRIRVDHLAMLVSRQASKSLEVGSPAPPLQLPFYEGGTFDLENHAGQIVILDFWASWCHPCRAALPRLGELAARMDGLELPVKVLTVNTAERASDLEALRVKVKGALDTLQFDLPVLLDLDGVVARQWGVSALPTTIVIDRLGRIASIHQGAGPEYIERLENQVKQLLPTD